MKRMWVGVALSLIFTGFAIWYIITHAPNPQHPWEFSPHVQRNYYCPGRCAPAYNQCIDQCMSTVNIRTGPP